MRGGNDLGAVAEAPVSGGPPSDMKGVTRKANSSP